MKTMSAWKTVTRHEPCQICGKPDWCGFTHDGAVRCMRFEAAEGWERISESNGGVVFRPSDQVEAVERQRSFVAMPPPMKLKNWNSVQVELFQEACSRRLHRRRFAESLGLDDFSLVMLGIGFHKRFNSWTFPMWDHDLRAVGIRGRWPDGNKTAIKGSSQGVFTTHATLEQQGDIYIAEGPTDAAALISFGCKRVIGRSNCKGNIDQIQKIAKGHAVHIIADRDEVGMQGALQLMESLDSIATRATVHIPPEKDLREWKKQGATKEDFELFIKAGSAHEEK